MSCVISREHLEGAGRIDDLHRLLSFEWQDYAEQVESERYRNAWYWAHDQIDELEGYLGDISRPGLWRMRHSRFSRPQIISDFSAATH